MNNTPEHNLAQDSVSEPEDVLRPRISSAEVVETHLSETSPQEEWPPDAASTLEPSTPNDSPILEVENEQHPEESYPVERPLFQSWSQPEARPPVRMPHLGDVAILAVFGFFGLLCASALIFSALHFHLFGVLSQQEAATEVHYTLGSEAILYIFTLGACLLFFPLIWHKNFFAGLQWNGGIALHLRKRLFVIASVCCGLALINGLLLPGPKDAPIDKIFRTPGAAWLLFAFGVTFAPFFEELVFRGFLLPAICTACDWTDETLFSRPDLSLGLTVRWFWSVVAMTAVASVLIGTPIALIYAIVKHSLALFLICLPIAPAIYLGLLAIRKPQADNSIPPLNRNGHPQWSTRAMVIAALATSAPFAGMHGAQTGYSWGPFVLLVGVSLVLCWARLSTRSLAASVLVHASYNFLLFSLMLLGTGGFRHLDKM